MGKNEQFDESLAKVCLHVEMGDFEKAEDLLNEASTKLSMLSDNNLIIQYYQIKIDLYRSTRRREQCIQLWDEMDKDFR